MGVKAIRCQNIIDGHRCKAPVTRKRARFCVPCAKERQRLANKATYYRHKKAWKPYYKKCECGTGFLVENRKQGKRIDCNECREKRSYPNGNYRNRKAPEPPRPNLNKSPKTYINVKCPTCHDTRPLKIHLANPEEYENGKVFWKRCHKCTLRIDGIDCPDANAYAIGRQSS